jgi:hypothetical protein
MNKKVGYRIEEIILVILILLNILDFIEWLPGDIDYIKKIISWTCLGYLLYKISLTKLFFGTKNKLIDFSLVSACFLMVLKNLIHYAQVARGEVHVLAELYAFLVNNRGLLDYVSFYIGGLLLIVIAVYCSFKLKVKQPSLLHVIHEKGLPKTLGKRIERFVMVYIVLIGFFVIVFNLVMEWLAIAVDASILVVAVLFYLFTAFRRHSKRFKPDTLIYKLGDVGEGFYESFIGLFHSKSRIFLGISGMLVLHLLTDVGVFIVPYVINIHDILYFGYFGEGHTALLHLFLKDLVLVENTEVFNLVWIYIFNLLAMLFLLILPAYIWYKLYKRKGFKVSHLELSLFFCSLVVFILAPAFRIEQITSPRLVGVDILTHSVLSYTVYALPVVVILSFLIGITGFLLSFNSWVKEKLILLGIVIIDMFFGFYVYSFFITYLNYYSGIVKLLVSQSRFFIGFYMIMFLIITSLFYVSGFVIFLFETRKEFRYIK